MARMTTTTAAPTLAQVVAAQVRAHAAMRGWTQTELAKRVGMSKMAVSDRHRERTPWTLDETQKLADLFGVEVGELLARPKGFEPLTFWLGANHTITVWPSRWLSFETWFCDLCGWNGPGRDGAVDHLEEHVLARPGEVCDLDAS